MGEAVLDIIQDEGLQTNARVTGEYLKRQLHERLQGPFPQVVGDVRGLGLFLGVECIAGSDGARGGGGRAGEKESGRDEKHQPVAGEEQEGRDEKHQPKEFDTWMPVPAPEAAAWIVARARMLGVQLSVDGPEENVLKIKPPLCFGQREADRLVGVLERAVGE